MKKANKDSFRKYLKAILDVVGEFDIKYDTNTIIELAGHLLMQDRKQEHGIRISNRIHREEKATDKQVAYLQKLYAVEDRDVPGDLTKREASELIEKAKNET